MPLEHSELWRIGFHVINVQEGKGSEVLVIMSAMRVLTGGLSGSLAAAVPSEPCWLPGHTARAEWELNLQVQHVPPLLTAC